VPIYAPNQDHRLYTELDILGSKFKRLGWRSIVATDLIIKMLHEIRPYEKIKGETDRVYSNALLQITDSIEKGGKDFFKILEKIVSSFKNIERIVTEKPVIGVVGEIYIRSNSFSNDNLIRKIEEFGGVAWLASISEWITYVNYINKKKSLRNGGVSDIMNFMITGFIQGKDEHHIEKMFFNNLKYGKEPKMSDIIRKASPYVHVSFEGEAILSIGKAVDFIHKGVSGIINAMPFTCMPGTVSSAIMKIIQKKYNLPIINIAYDGQGATNITTRLEAFMYQVKDNFHNNNN
jgi:predicted nucleotide-binding protein (sugar kinase/HSP70/actin superfamily)